MMFILHCAVILYIKYINTLVYNTASCLRCRHEFDIGRNLTKSLRYNNLLIPFLVLH